MEQLSPKSIWLFFFSTLFRWFFIFIFFGFYAITPFLALAVGGYDKPILGILGWFLLVLVIFLALCFGWAKLCYRFYKYELIASGFRKESGVIYKRYVTIPYERIQNVDINRGILARLLGLSDLHIQTAGASAVVNRFGMRGAGSEGRLPGVTREVAEKLRDELINRSRQPRNQGL